MSRTIFNMLSVKLELRILSCCWAGSKTLWQMYSTTIQILPNLSGSLLEESEAMVVLFEAHPPPPPPTTHPQCLSTDLHSSPLPPTSDGG